MPLTPETLSRHELVGLEVEVVDASSLDAVGISGTVVMETTQMLTIESGDRVWQVPKDSATFAFDLPAGQDGAHRAAEHVHGETPRTRVRVDGKRLVARPARRTANAGDSKWR